ncbi:hypothetical protein F5Y17DRAFT_93395 [Xylariaceae sp. FL0594]|nr:hypothetical protein F5Y17DRAFT_93395 [Xylariaceae sp. FL0594]
MSQSSMRAFSQLTADNQFAPLGVVLLGVLAGVQAACNDIAPPPTLLTSSSPSPSPSSLDRSSLSTAAANLASIGLAPADDRQPAGAPDVSRAGEQGADTKGDSYLGRAISREELERAEDTKSKKKQKHALCRSSREDSMAASSPMDPLSPGLRIRDERAEASLSKPPIVKELFQNAKGGDDDEKQTTAASRPAKRIKTTTSRATIQISTSTSSLFPTPPESRPVATSSTANRRTKSDGSSSSTTHGEEKKKDQKVKTKASAKSERSEQPKKKKKSKNAGGAGGGDAIDDLFKDLF